MIIEFVGPPGAGKTTLAKYLAKSSVIADRTCYVPAGSVNKLMYFDKIVRCFGWYRAINIYTEFAWNLGIKRINILQDKNIKRLLALQYLYSAIASQHEIKNKFLNSQELKYNNCHDIFILDKGIWQVFLSILARNKNKADLILPTIKVEADLTVVLQRMGSKSYIKKVEWPINELETILKKQLTKQVLIIRDWLDIDETIMMLQSEIKQKG